MNKNPKKRVAILVSGAGTNMANIIRQIREGRLDCEIALMICDRSEAYALKRAAELGLETKVLERGNFKSKSEFDAAISQCLEKKRVDLILLAGFMRILGPEFVRQWRWKILNIHPSLLPKFPGAHAIRDAFEAKEKETGVTIHFVDEGIDSGPIILQKKISILPTDTLETLEARVHQMEYELYPQAIRLFLEGKLRIMGRRVEVMG